MSSVLHPVYPCFSWYMCTHGHPHISSRRPLKTSSHLAAHAHVSPILTRLLCGKTFGSGAQFSVALAPSLPNFQVIVPHVPFYVSIALQEEDLRATGWNPMLHQKKCTRYGLIQLCGSLQGRYGFSSLFMVRSGVMTLFRARMTRTNREAWSPPGPLSREECSTDDGRFPCHRT